MVTACAQRLLADLTGDRSTWPWLDAAAATFECTLTALGDFDSDER